jgi:hypothetical protein
MDLVHGVETAYQKAMKKMRAKIVKPQRKVRRGERETPLDKMLKRRSGGR